MAISEERRKQLVIKKGEALIRKIERMTAEYWELRNRGEIERNPFFEPEGDEKITT